MTNPTPGLHYLKKQITVDAPVEVCYQTWIDSARMPEFMSRLISVQLKAQPSRVFTSPEELNTLAPILEQFRLPYGKIKHWLISGPAGKLYEIENTVVLEIPNHFYCTTSIDPNDLSVQSSLFFCPDGKNEHTFIEWEISFWASQKKGSSTQLLTDVLNTEDPLFEQCLQDFKAHLEGGHPNHNGHKNGHKKIKPSSRLAKLDSRVVRNW